MKSTVIIAIYYFCWLSISNNYVIKASGSFTNLFFFWLISGTICSFRFSKHTFAFVSHSLSKHNSKQGERQRYSASTCLCVCVNVCVSAREEATLNKRKMNLNIIAISPCKALSRNEQTTLIITIVQSK